MHTGACVRGRGGGLARVAVDGDAVKRAAMGPVAAVALAEVGTTACTTGSGRWPWRRHDRGNRVRALTPEEPRGEGVAGESRSMEASGGQHAEGAVRRRTAHRWGEVMRVAVLCSRERGKERKERERKLKKK